MAVFCQRSITICMMARSISLSAVKGASAYLHLAIEASAAEMPFSENT